MMKQLPRWARSATGFCPHVLSHNERLLAQIKQLQELRAAALASCPRSAVTRCSCWLLYCMQWVDQEHDRLPSDTPDDTADRPGPCQAIV